MISLLRSEIRRLTSRRVARVTAILIIGFLLLTLGRVFQLSHKDAGPQLAVATAQANAERAHCEDFKASTQGQSRFDVDCDDIKPEDFFDDPRLHGDEALPQGTKAVAVAVAIFAFAVAASYVGADWSAGTMQALLFWETRRWRVVLAKALALVTVVAAFLVVVEVVNYAGLWLTAATRGTTDGVTAGLHMSNLLTVLRGMIVVSCCALLAFAIAGLARHSGASLVVGFVYFVVLENLIRGLRPGWQRFLFSENVNAILSKRMEVVPAHAKSIFNDEGIKRVYVLTGARGTLTLGIYLAILLGAFYLAFTRRDVT